MKSLILNAWKDNKGFVLFLILMFAFRSAVADWNTVPTGSMKPTIIEGDRVLVNKLAYDVKVPFTSLTLKKMADPARGDIVVFNSEAADLRMVKRVVGVPGDLVELRNNHLIINHEPLDYKAVESNTSTLDRLENLLGVEHVIRVERYGSRRSSFPQVRVPEDFYLVLGDNRDNSSDSRVYGFVPRDEIIGRSRSVVMSLNYDNFYIPRKDRFFHTL